MTEEKRALVVNNINIYTIECISVWEPMEKVFGDTKGTIVCVAHWIFPLPVEHCVSAMYGEKKKIDPLLHPSS